MSIAKLAFTFSLLLNSLAFAKDKHYLLMGGGGEKKGPNTIFDIEVKNSGKFFSSGWSADISFNGGHSNTEKILESTFGRNGVQNQTFTDQSFENKIKKYEEKILSGEIGPGDQLLIQISSHGAKASDSDLTHKISAYGSAATDMNDLSGSKVVSLDDLERLTKLAQEKGIKLGILDFSCHSGASLALANSNTCVISSTGPNHFGWANNNLVFQAQFTSLLKKGKSLEEIFLKAQEKKVDTGFPMISTAIGRELQDEIYTQITPFLYDTRGESSLSKFSNYMENEVQQNSCRTLPSHFEKLIAFSHEMEQFAKGGFFIFGSNPNYQKFRNALQIYHEKQKEVLAALAVAESPEMKKEEKVCSSYLGRGSSGSRKSLFSICETHTVKDILTGHYDNFITMLENQLKEMKDPSDIAAQKARLENANKFKAIAENIRSTRPDLVRAADVYGTIPNLNADSYRLSSTVAREFQKLYVDVYSKKMKSDKSANPCRDFIL